MPAHNGVDSKLYPCSGSQMPCSQMISMNCSPPRPIDDISPARLPMPNAVERNSLMSTIGSRHPQLDEAERHQQQQTERDRTEHPRVGPPGR